MADAQRVHQGCTAAMWWVRREEMASGGGGGLIAAVTRLLRLQLELEHN